MKWILPSFAGSFFALALCAAAGCSSSGVDINAPGSLSQDGAVDGDAGADAACSTGAMRCASNALETCDNGSWAVKEACGVGQVCDTDACRPASARALKRLQQIQTAMKKAKSIISNPEPVLLDVIDKLAWTELAKGDTDEHYGAALRVAFQSLKQGHQNLIFDDCFWQTSDIGYAGYSRYGVCLRAAGKGMVVSSSLPGNVLGLVAGDEIIGVEKAGVSLDLDAYALRITLCTPSYPSLVSTRHHAALSLAAGFEAGTKIRVRSDVGERTVEIPLPPSRPTLVDCSDPMMRDGYEVSARILPNGIGMIHLRTLDPSDLTENMTDAEFQAALVRFAERVRVEFEKVKGAKGIVWDLRGNGGGVTAVGLEIASGMPGAKSGVFTECYHRSNTSVPATFVGPTHHYELTPGGRFQVAPGTKVAVVIDGSDYSAADYLPYFIRNATNVKLVGETTAGAFGGGRNPVTIADATMPATISVDPTGCRAMNGDLLEGKGVEPHIRVELDPASLRAGIDNVLERAIQEVK